MNYFGQKKSALKCYIPNDVTLQIESIALLCTVIREIHSNFVNAILNNVENVSEIDAKTVQDSIKPLIPKNLRRYAFCNASRHVVLYQSGLITHKERVMDTEPVRGNFKNGVKCIMQDFNSSAARGFMPYINSYLNDICHALAEKSCQNAQRNNYVLTDIDVLSAIDDFLPQELKRHALARIYQLQKSMVLPPTSSRRQSEAPVTEDEMTNDETEESVYQSAESNYFLDTASQLLGGKEIKNNETDKEKSKVTFLDMARGWLSPTTGGNQEDNLEETESVESEETRSREKQKEDSEREKSVLTRAWEWLSPSIEQTEIME